MYLIDTDILSLFESGHEAVVKRIHEHSNNIGTTVVTQAEVLRNRCERLLKANDEQQILLAQKWFDLSMQVFGQILVLPFDERASKEFLTLLQLKGIRRIGRADMLIASIVLANKGTLVTRNRKHFDQVPNLITENWAD